MGDPGLIPSCPLCLGQESTLVEEIPARQIAALYQRLVPACDLGGVLGSEVVELRSCSSCGLGYFTPVVQAPVQLYEELSKLPWYYLGTKPEFEFAKRFIRSGSTVLDVGCGGGAFADYLDDTEYVGIDENPGAVRRARELGLTVELSSLDRFSSLGYPQFDVVCALQVLEHVLSPSSFIDQLKNWARTGGTIIVSVPAADSFVSLEVNEPLNLPPHHLTWWFDHALLRLGEIKGLDLVWMHHEVLSPEFRDRYARCLVNEILRRALSRQHKVVNVSLVGVSIRRIASLLGKILAVGLSNSRLSPRGHSVTAVFRKPTSS